MPHDLKYKHVVNLKILSLLHLHFMQRQHCFFRLQLRIHVLPCTSHISIYSGATIQCSFSSFTFINSFTSSIQLCLYSRICNLKTMRYCRCQNALFFIFALDQFVHHAKSSVASWKLERYQKTTLFRRSPTLFCNVSFFILSPPMFRNIISLNGTRRRLWASDGSRILVDQSSVVQRPTLLLRLKESAVNGMTPGHFPWAWECAKSTMHCIPPSVCCVQLPFNTT
jgi:hypothetical protein